MELPLPPYSWIILAVYVAIISVCSVIACFYDKKISKLRVVKLRIPEKSLFVWSALGGSVAMFATMLLIRHKTKHISFMVGIPLIMVLQVALLVALVVFGILPMPF